MTEASFEALRKVQLQEKHESQLAELEEDFFEKYRSLIELQRERLRKDFSLEAATSFENLRRLLAEVTRKREQKLFLKALRDFHAGEVSGEGLAREERELYNSLVRLLSEYEARAMQQSSASAAKEVDKRVRFSSDVPAFVGASGAKIGPFAAGQVAPLPATDAKLLLEQGVVSEA
jgi:DNA replication initiation complex subunit (GINS family)